MEPIAIRPGRHRANPPRVRHRARAMSRDLVIGTVAYFAFLLVAALLLLRLFASGPS